MITSTALKDPAKDSRDQTRTVARQLIRAIQSDGLVVGDRLPSIRELARRFDASASVVRDALMQVQTMGLVKILPRSGAFVQSADYTPLVGVLTETFETFLGQMDHNLFHLLETRELIEVECAARAARRRRLEDLLPVREALDRMEDAIDRMHAPDSDAARIDFVNADIEFHAGIAQIAGNPILVTMLRALLGLMRPHLAQIPWTMERKEVTSLAHLKLYDALLDGDSDRAAAAMREHLKMAYDGLLKKIWSRPAGRPSAAEGVNGVAT
jgi:GntR family transcriptional repressor for pyruvate dehydrogenase complex